MADAGEGNSLSKELSDLRRLTLDIKSLLNSQRETLSRAGLAMPPGVSEGLTQLAASLERIGRAVHEQEQERLQLQALAEIGSVVNSSLDLTTVLNEVMDTIIKLTGAERGFLMLKNDAGVLDFRIARNVDRETLQASAFEISRTIMDRVAQTGEPVVTTNAQEDPRFGKQESVVAFNLRSILCVPLKMKGELTGVIYADNRVRTGLFNERDRDILAAFANQAAVAIENARLFENVKHSLDEVTRLKNLLNNVITSISSGVITTDVTDTVTLCNRAAESILNITSRQTVGAPYSTALPFYDGKLSRAVADIKRSDRVVAYEVNPTLPGRGLVDLSLSLAPLKDWEWTTQGVAIVLDDVTEKKRLRSKFELFQRMVNPAVIERLDPNQLKLGGDRQQVSCLFADIRGFTNFSEHLDPVVLLDVLNRYLGAAADAVLLHEGTLDKFLGDAVMAIFNAPELQPDHTMRAVRAALNMRYDILALHEVMEPQYQLSFGMAINVGEAVVGLVGTKMRLDYTAIGDTINTAKRLQENAKAGQVLLSETAYEQVKDQVIAVQLEPVKVKGRAQPVQIYELQDIR
ncbi:MAG: GAF domain-containing protein [Chloroflexi bacterium]|nr:GAF domain-containing protein [Chloroflexota bacterium]